MTSEILNHTDHCLNEKIKKLIGLMKNELVGEIVKEFIGLRAKIYTV